MNNPTPPKRIRNHVNPLADQTEIYFDGFNNNKPLIVDIGAYRGEFVRQLIDTLGDNYNYLVTEIRKPYVQYLEELFVSYPNVQVFGGDTSRNISGLLEKSHTKGVQISHIFVNFPDPWFKEKHKKRRVVNLTFLEKVRRYLGNQGQLIFQTDQEQLFRETIEVIEESGGWNIECFEDPTWGIQSHWEQMKIKENNKVYRMKITAVC